MKSLEAFLSGLKQSKDLDIRRKIVSWISPSGTIGFTDGTTGTFQGDDVQVGGRYVVINKVAINLRWQNVKARVIGKKPKDIKTLLVLCLGTSTGLVDGRKYYSLDKDTLEEVTESDVSDWIFTDDGKYGVIWDGVKLDPDDYEAVYEGNGIKVFAQPCAIPAKRQVLKSVRYILNSAWEDDEAWLRYIVNVNTGYLTFTHHHLIAQESLIFMPYRRQSLKALCTKYTDNGIVMIPALFSGYDAVVQVDTYAGENFLDVLPRVPKIYRYNWNGIRSETALQDWSDPARTGEDITVSAVDLQNYDKLSTYIMQDRCWLFGSSQMVEPSRRTRYDNGNLTVEAAGAESYRSADHVNNEAYYLSDIWSSGLSFSSLGIPTIDFSDIENDVRLVQSLSPDTVTGHMTETYVRCKKAGDFSRWQTGVYCHDVLISPFEDEETILLYIDYSSYNNPGTGNTFRVYGDNTPLRIRRTQYRIIQCYHNKNYHAVLYAKATYKEHADQLLDYYALRNIGYLGASDLSYLEANYGKYYQVRRTQVKSIVEYFVWVGTISNSVSSGRTHKLIHNHINREYMFTTDHTPNLSVPGGSSEVRVYLGQQRPWVDVGFDESNNPVQGEDNSVIERAYFDGTSDKLLLVADVFPVEYRHVLTYVPDAGSQSLYAEFDESLGRSFPPASDAYYYNVKARVMMLFNWDGSLRANLAAPSDPRVNGVMMLNADDYS